MPSLTAAAQSATASVDPAALLHELGLALATAGHSDGESLSTCAMHCQAHQVGAVTAGLQGWQLAASSEVPLSVGGTGAAMLVTPATVRP